jgi:hypothetical protein
MATERMARALGAFALLVAGGVHLQQYSAAHFAVIPTIGLLFLANLSPRASSACSYWSRSAQALDTVGSCSTPWPRCRTSGSGGGAPARPM